MSLRRGSRNKKPKYKEEEFLLDSSFSPTNIRVVKIPDITSPEHFPPLKQKNKPIPGWQL